MKKRIVPCFLPLALVLVAHAGALGAKRCDLSDTGKLTLKSFDKCTQIELDVFYRELGAGPIIPDGDFNGKIQLAKPGKSEKFKLKQFMQNLVPNVFLESQEFLLERLWGGKVFYRESANRAVLFNKVFQVHPRFGRQMFPAHVYYGQSLFDPTKLSIVIDYKYNQNIEGYRPASDWIVNENGLAIRDEIRQVNQRVYLGRAYVKGRFLLNFVLGRAP